MKAEDPPQVPSQKRPDNYRILSAHSSSSLAHETCLHRLGDDRWILLGQPFVYADMICQAIYREKE